MQCTTGIDTKPRIPAWRRLGLKLKSAPEQSNLVVKPMTHDTLKRKRAEMVHETSTAGKTTKTSAGLTMSGIQNPLTPSLGRRKSVTFTPDTKVEDGDSIKELFNSWIEEQKSQKPSFELKKSNTAFEIPIPPDVEEHIDTSLGEKQRRINRVKRSKQECSKTNSSKPFLHALTPGATTRPFLEYLRQYYESRASWKFNKNHQTHLLKHIFDRNIIPSDHAHLIYPYIRGLQGIVRTRLRDAALEIKVKDQEAGTAGFPADISSPEQKQKEYEAILKDYISREIGDEPRSKEMSHEESIVLSLEDAAMKDRVIKRTRAEMILHELASSPDAAKSNLEEPSAEKAEKRARMNDGSSQKIARKRKQRTIAINDNSSESTSNSESSSDEDTVEHEGPSDTSSSSSSSSESDSDTNSDSDTETDSNSISSEDDGSDEGSVMDEAGDGEAGEESTSDESESSDDD